MKAALIGILVFSTALPAFGQITARRLTRNVAPQPQQPARPAPVPQYGTAAPVAPPRAVTPAEAAKAKAENTRNEAKQFDFYKRRAEEGSDHAQLELGMRYLTGKGVEKNEKLAREWMAKAAKQGNVQAKKKLDELGPAPAVSEKPVIEAKPVPLSGPAAKPTETPAKSK